MISLKLQNSEYDYIRLRKEKELNGKNYDLWSLEINPQYKNVERNRNSKTQKNILMTKDNLLEFSNIIKKNINVNKVAQRNLSNTQFIIVESFDNKNEEWIHLTTEGDSPVPMIEIQNINTDDSQLFCVFSIKLNVQDLVYKYRMEEEEYLYENGGMYVGQQRLFKKTPLLQFADDLEAEAKKYDKKPKGVLGRVKKWLS